MSFTPSGPIIRSTKNTKVLCGYLEGKYLSEMATGEGKWYNVYISLQRCMPDGVTPVLAPMNEVDHLKTFRNLPLEYTKMLKKRKFSVLKICHFYKLDSIVIHSFFNGWTTMEFAGENISIANHEDVDRFLEIVKVDSPEWYGKISKIVFDNRKLAKGKLHGDIVGNRTCPAKRHNRTADEATARNQGEYLSHIAKEFKTPMLTVLMNLIRMGHIDPPKIEKQIRTSRRIQLFQAAREDMDKIGLHVWATFYSIEAARLPELADVINQASMGLYPKKGSIEARWLLYFRADFPYAIPEIPHLQAA